MYTRSTADSLVAPLAVRGVVAVRGLGVAEVVLVVWKALIVVQFGCIGNDARRAFTLRRVSCSATQLVHVAAAVVSKHAANILASKPNLLQRVARQLGVAGCTDAVRFGARLPDPAARIAAAFQGADSTHWVGFAVVAVARIAGERPRNSPRCYVWVICTVSFVCTHI